MEVLVEVAEEAMVAVVEEAVVELEVDLVKKKKKSKDSIYNTAVLI